MLLPAALILAALTLATPSASPQDSRPVDDAGRWTFELFVEALRPTGSFDDLSVSAQANHTLSYTYTSASEARPFLLRNPTSAEWKARFIEAAHVAGPSAAVLQAHVAPIALFGQLLEQTAPAREAAERFCVSRGYESIEALRLELEGTFLPGVTLLLEKNTFDAQAADAPENDGTEVAAWTLLFTTKETFGKNRALKLLRTRLMHYYALENTKAKKPTGVFSLREGPMTIVEFQEKKIRGTGHLAMAQVDNTLFVSNSTSVLRKQLRRSLRHGKGKQNTDALYHAPALAPLLAKAPETAGVLLWIDLKHWGETKSELVQELKRMNPFGSREPIATLISVTPGTNEIRWHAGLPD